MVGFEIGKKGAFLDSVRFDVSTISLLARGDGAEVLLQSMKKGKSFYMNPSEDPEVMEFCFIISGEIECEIENERVKLGPQDYFTSKGLMETIHFNVLSDVQILWITTEPIFVHLSKEISSLMEVVKHVEKKDRYTLMHSDRVAKYSVKIAKKLKLGKAQMEAINTASSLHDIGKIHIPEEILNKPAGLTAEEFAIVKKHSADGAEMLKGTVYEELCPIILQHHERLNGSGYPHGLKGDEILLEARIIAVSDTFDAMTEDRSYRKAFTDQYAVDEIKRLVHTHYDKEVVDAFLEVLREEGRI